MGLLFTSTHDQALLAFVIAKSRDVANKRGGFLGRTAVQKIMYFLKNAGVPMGYRFSIYHYGPFSDDILRDTDLLIADSVISDRSTQTAKFSDYNSGEAIDELLRHHEDAINPWQETITRIIGDLAPFNAERLEATATLDYIYRQQLATGLGQPTMESVVAKFMELKGDKFRRLDVENIYQMMLVSGTFK